MYSDLPTPPKKKQEKYYQSQKEGIMYGMLFITLGLVTWNKITFTYVDPVSICEIHPHRALGNHVVKFILYCMYKVS